MHSRITGHKVVCVATAAAGSAAQHGGKPCHQLVVTVNCTSRRTCTIVSTQQGRDCSAAELAPLTAAGLDLRPRGLAQSVALLGFLLLLGQRLNIDGSGSRI